MQRWNVNDTIVLLFLFCINSVYWTLGGVGATYDSSYKIGRKLNQVLQFEWNNNFTFAHLFNLGFSAILTLQLEKYAEKKLHNLLWFILFIYLFCQFMNLRENFGTINSLHFVSMELYNSNVFNAHCLHFDHITCVT